MALAMAGLLLGAVGCKDAEKEKPLPAGPAGLEGRPVNPSPSNPATAPAAANKPEPASVSSRTEGKRRILTARATQPWPPNTDAAEGERVAAATARVLAQLALLKELEKIEGKKMTGLEPSRRLQGAEEQVQKAENAVTVVIELALP